LTPGAACGKNTPSEAFVHDHGEGDCRQLFDLLSPFIDGELSGSPCDEIARHMACCEPCRRYIESLRATREVLHRMGQSEPVPSTEAKALLAECMKTVRAKFSDKGSP
jgi:anti-sigma factor (TIGR02949 family)